MKSLIIGTRASALALWQAHWVQGLIASSGAQAEIKKISTKGDLIQDRSLIQIGGKGLFLKEIQEELLKDKIDLAVHSLKDVPYEATAELSLVAFLPREDRRDAVVTRTGKLLKDLPVGSIIGTSSLRRIIQLKKCYPHLVFKDIRGNVDTRLSKMNAGKYDAVVLAGAGLHRLGLASVITEYLDIVGAGGQGIVVIEAKSTRLDVINFLSRFNDKNAQIEAELERYFVAKLQGSCQIPVGCSATYLSDSKCVKLEFFFASQNESYFFERHETCSLESARACIDDTVAIINKERR